MIEFAGTDMREVRAMVRRGEVVVLLGVPDRDLGSDQWTFPRPVVESVGDCAAVPLCFLTGGEEAKFPLVVGQKEAIRSLCAAADPVPPAPFPYESRTLRTHYRAHRDLWLKPEEFRPDEPVFQIGLRLAQLHSRDILHGDARRENWDTDPETGTVVVGDNDIVFLYCAPSTAQCATDVAPLLPDLDPNSWHNFRLGYLGEWPDGQPVIDMIQLGDRTGWAMPFRTGRFPEAVTLLRDQLADETDQVLRVLLLANQALALSCAGGHTPAMDSFAECAELAAAHAPHAVRGLAFVIGFLLLRQGDIGEATAMFAEFGGDPRAMVTRFAPKGSRPPIVNL